MNRQELAAARADAGETLRRIREHLARMERHEHDAKLDAATLVRLHRCIDQCRADAAFLQDAIHTMDGALADLDAPAPAPALPAPSATAARVATDAEKAFAADIGRRVAHAELEQLSKRTTAPTGQRFDRARFDQWADRHWSRDGGGRRYIRSAIASLFGDGEAEIVAAELSSSAWSSYFMLEPTEMARHAETARAGEIEADLLRSLCAA